ncbi:MAG: sulfatase-like hydrolase/transferase [Crocinitomix sp.]|nr:sulfatase-like hydrolase/transferase [Crocinitomix sp.]
MKGQLKFFGKLLATWLIVFLFQRLLFIFHFFGDFSGNYGELFLIPFHGLKLDLSAFGYISGVAFLLSVPTFFLTGERALKIINRIILIYFWIILIAVSILMSAEIVTYIEWRTKLTNKIFLHLATPSEMFRTATAAYTFWYFFYFVLQLVFAYFLYNRWFKKNKIQASIQVLLKRVIYSLSYLLVGAFILVLMIRGGLQQIPVSATDGYFSQKPIVNDVTVNPVWNFINMTFGHLKVDLSIYFHNLDPKESDALTAALYANEGIDTVKIFNQKHPNIVLVQLEGWSGQMIEPLGGEPGITPHFNQLCEEGLLFTKIYSTGGTSETGTSSIISGYPTISGISITTQSSKSRQLPSLNKSFEALGYNSLYTFGGSLSYGNIGAYLTEVGFDRIIDEDDLDLTPTGKLGIHDEAMFPYFLSEIQKAKRPYFYGLFTQSTHAPYDMPVEHFPGYDNDGYITSMHYADEHLAKFVAGIRNLPDFDNTVVVFISDHGRLNLYNMNRYNERYFHIPLLIWGGALKGEYAGQTIDKVGSQADLAKTLLNQLDMNSDAYHWSKDLLDPSTQAWALCTSTLSYGWKDADGYTVYHMVDDRLVHSPYSDQKEIDAALKKCRAVLEAMYREYIEF